MAKVATYNIVTHASEISTAANLINLNDFELLSPWNRFAVTTDIQLDRDILTSAFDFSMFRWVSRSKLRAFRTKRTLYDSKLFKRVYSRC